jgi:hypothetical protein
MAGRILFVAGIWMGYGFGHDHPYRRGNMAKKQAGKPKMPVGVASDSDIRNIQIQLPVGPYEKGKEIAKANGLSMAAYVRQAILQRIRQDEEKMEGSK